MSRLARWSIRLVLAAVLPAVLFVAWDQATFNFGTVESGRLYRSGQMPARALARAVRDHKIKTVMNLRGQNPRDLWYSAERAATLGAGATQVDIAMSSCLWLSRAQLRAIIQTLQTADYPMLIHCAWGSERTGLVSAFAELLRPGATLEDARAQFSIRHLFVRTGDGKIMAEHLDQYESWLATGGLAHSPEAFLRWVGEGFRPMNPSREQWPYDPYPLVVTTRPVATSPAAPIAGRVPGTAQR
jgi:hypothetical protein